MKTRMVWLLLLGLLAVPAQAQWNHYVQLTSDTFSNGQSDFAVDDSFRIHLFYSSFALSLPQMNSLYYQRFDSWGNPLSARMEMEPDTFHTESPPGVLLDRNQNLHVVWVRWYAGSLPDDLIVRAYYARMNLQGDFLTGPCELGEEGELMYSSGISVVQDCTGVVWVVCGSYEGYYCALTEDGEIIIPLTPLSLGLGRGSLGACLALSPSDEVWACARIVGGGPQNISIIRLDTSVQQLEVVSPNNPDNEIFGMGVPGFLIDSGGAFHYVLYRDDWGLFYQRDARDGSPSDTLVLDPSPYGVGCTRPMLADDTLNFLWGQTSPQLGIWRVGISLTGQMIYGPQFISIGTGGRHFGIESRARLIWKEGSYWLMGGIFISTEQRGQVCMIHVPGPNEPPNAVEMRPPLMPESPQLSIYPNPLNPSGMVVMDLARRGLVNVEVFDVLGRRAANLANGVFEAGRHELNFDARALPTGIYFVQMRTAERMVTKKAVVVK